MDENDEIVIDLGKFITICFRSIHRFRKLMLLILILSVLIAELGTFLTFKTTYSSEAMFIATTDTTDNIFWYNDSEDEKDNLSNTISEIVNGPVMKTTILKKLDKDVLNGTITTSRIEETNLIRLKVTSDNAKDAYEIIDCILTNYKDITQYSMSDVDLIIMDKPRLAKAPDEKPDYMKMLFIGLAAGLVINIAIMCLYAFFRNTILDSKDIDEKLNLKTIVNIPFFPYSRTHRDLMITNTHVHYLVKKAFYDIRLYIERQYKKHGYKVFMFTSTLPHEGKSVSSINTALSLAKEGLKVALIDLDLRKSTVRRTLDVSEDFPGIRDFISGNAGKDDIIYHYEEGSIDVVLAGVPTTDALQYLESPRLSALIAEFRDEYDYVILDVPPLYGLQDTLIIGAFTDCAIVVVKQDYAKTTDIVSVINETSQAGIAVKGIILNQVKHSVTDDESSHYGYNYKHGYGYYGYGYGYGYGYDRYGYGYGYAEHSQHKNKNKKKKDEVADEITSPSENE